jgi:uncharacterized damage-inducible protein DinB
MKELLVSYASYNYWANQELIKCILKLDPEKQEQEVMSSFTSLHTTIIHMWDAESIWWQRMKLKENIIIPSLSFHPTVQEAVNGLLQQSRDWAEWTKQATEPQLEHVFSYRNTKKEEFKQPTWQVMLQVFNHGSYHRGQLVTMLRQLGEENIPQTDYIVYSRKK